MASFFICDNRIIFGGHFMIVGYLTFKSDDVPKVGSILMLIASINYIIIHFSYTFLPQFYGFTKMLESILSIPMILGEMGWYMAAVQRRESSYQ
jgi:hypothetical protein